MKLLYRLSLAIAVGGVAGHANALTSWSWDFLTSQVNVAYGLTATATITNASTSTTDLLVQNIDFTTFGNFGLFYEPGFRGIITSTMLQTQHIVHPGQSFSAAVIGFTLQANNLPSEGITYITQPKLTVVVGNGCVLPDVDTPNCIVDSAIATSPFTITYSTTPIPEPSSYLLMIMGAPVVALVALRRRRVSA